MEQDAATGQGIGRRARKKAETRARILESALELFKRSGFEATTVGQIAEAADVSRQTCFNHFPEKSAIVAALGDEMTAQFQAAIERVRKLDASTGARLEALFAEEGRRLLGVPDLSRVMLQETVATRRHVSNPQGRTAKLHASMATLLADGVASGDVRSDVPLALLAEMAAGTMNEIMLTWLVVPDYPLVERLHTAAALFATSLAPANAAPVSMLRENTPTPEVDRDVA